MNLSSNLTVNLRPSNSQVSLSPSHTEVGLSPSHTEASRSPSHMQAWLEADLAAANLNRAQRPWVIVYGHRPMYCTTDGDCDEAASTVPARANAGVPARAKAGTSQG